MKTINRELLASLVKAGKIRLSQHAKKRLEQRGIGIDAIVDTLINGKVEHSAHNADSGEDRWCGKRATLRPIFIISTYEVYVITVMYVDGR